MLFFVPSSNIRYFSVPATCACYLSIYVRVTANLWNPFRTHSIIHWKLFTSYVQPFNQMDTCSLLISAAIYIYPNMAKLIYLDIWKAIALILFHVSTLLITISGLLSKHCMYVWCMWIKWTKRRIESALNHTATNKKSRIGNLHSLMYGQFRPINLCRPFCWC